MKNHFKRYDEIFLIIFFVVFLLLGMYLFSGCVNPAAQRFSKFAIEDCQELVIKNPYFNSQEKRLYLVMLHLANEFSDEDVDKINKIYKEEKKFITPKILEIYKKYGIELRVEEDKK